jgi:hypothetical protein
MLKTKKYLKLSGLEPQLFEVFFKKMKVLKGCSAKASALRSVPDSADLQTSSSMCSLKK